MPTFTPGDCVHVAGLGTGTVREARNGGRYVVEIKGRTVIVDGGQLEQATTPRRGRGSEGGTPPAAEGNFAGARAAGSDSLDLHGRTVAEAVELLDIFLSNALLASRDDVRIIHGRSGGRIKAAVHKRLRQLPSVRSFGVDPGNPGVTIVKF
jgi:DNA mismatch repair protein MutS2